MMRPEEVGFTVDDSSMMGLVDGTHPRRYQVQMTGKPRQLE